MDRSNEQESGQLTELGIASSDTRGPLGDMIEAVGLWHKAGIADS